MSHLFVCPPNEGQGVGFDDSEKLILIHSNTVVLQRCPEGILLPSLDYNAAGLLRLLIWFDKQRHPHLLFRIFFRCKLLNHRFKDLITGIE